MIWTPTRANITHVIPRISKLYQAGAEQRTFFKAAINNSDVLETMMEHYSQHTRSLAILVINTSQWTSSIKKAIFKSDFVIMRYNGVWTVNCVRKVNISWLLDEKTTILIEGRQCRLSKVLFNKTDKSTDETRPERWDGWDWWLWSPGREGRRAICSDTWQLGIITRQPGDILQSYQLSSTIGRNSPQPQQVNPVERRSVNCLRRVLYCSWLSLSFVISLWLQHHLRQDKTRQCQVVCKAIKGWTGVEAVNSCWL